MSLEDVPIIQAGAQMVAAIPRLCRYARALVGDRNAADDLVQDTFERAWTKLGNWRTGSDMRAWLFGIMHNLYIDQRRRPTLPMTPTYDETIEVSTRANQSDALEMRDLTAALAQLPAEQRQVLLLVSLEDMTYEDVGRTLDIPVGTVMSRLSRARARLRTLIEEGHTRQGALKVVK